MHIYMQFCATVSKVAIILPIVVPMANVNPFGAWKFPVYKVQVSIVLLSFSAGSTGSVTKLAVFNWPFLAY